jgi:xanthine dehydrogenase accessory factor
MITPAQSRRTRELAAAREPFVTATVVRVERPASVEPGSVALVLADGTIEGFVGGVCAEHSVRAYSMQALRRDASVMLRIVPDPDADAAPEGAEVSSEDGIVTVANPCLSGGTIEVFLEPVPPPPRVVVVGETPIAAALVRIGSELGLEMVATGGSGGDPEPSAGDLGLVVAAHGRNEVDALRRALEAEVPYVGLVASEKRGAGVLAELRSAGVPEELLDRIDVPAGIPIGSHGAGEVAVSVHARIVSVRRGSAGGEPDGSAADGGGVAVDPICGMTVAAAESTLSVERDGETIYFCGEGCKSEFEAQENASVAG